MTLTRARLSTPHALHHNCELLFAREHFRERASEAAEHWLGLAALKGGKNASRSSVERR